MTVTVDGVDLTPYIANRGLKWQRSDVEAPDAGRTLDGIMHRGRVATKIRLDITCRPLTSGEASIVLNAIYPEFVTVSYNPASFLLRRADGTEWWDGITFPLIEQ